MRKNLGSGRQLRSGRVVLSVVLSIVLSILGILTFAGCGHYGAPRLGTPSMREMKVYVPPQAGFVAEEGSLPEGLDRRFSEAVQTYLRQSGVTVIAQPGVPADAALALEGRLKEVAGVLRGSIAVTIWGGSAVVDQLRWDVLQSSSSFIREKSRQAVSDVLGSRAFVAYADQRAIALRNPPPPAPTAASAPERTREQAAEEARVHAKNATTEYNAQQFAAALAEYEAAYADYPDPALLFNIAQCHRRLGHGPEAIDFYRRYLQAAPDSPKRSEIEKHIAELEHQK